MKTKEYDVMREHLGDKPYRAGDIRTMVAADAANLLQMGVLMEKSDKPLANKAEPAPANKMSSAPANKASSKPATKRD